MKVTKLLALLLLAVSFVLTVNAAPATAGDEVRAAGINLRGSYWNIRNVPTKVKVNEYGSDSYVSTGGGGAWLTFFSRVNDNLFLELSFGAAAAVEEHSSSWFEENVDVAAVTPIVLGLRHNLLSPRSQSALQPYVSFGGGPYWVSDIVAVDNNFEEEVSIDTELFRGGYAGGGFNFMVTNWFGINMDMKYHFIDFNVNHELSGPEYGFGVTFMWGKYSLSN